MADYELPGVFYLGREYDLKAAKAKPDYLLYDSKDLVTHAVCVGMTGSGKTGLCLALLEEAAIDGIPAIIIDPKGDIGNLMLTFPKLQPSDFQPWIDPGEAKRKQQTPEEYATKVAETWKKGLADWDEQPERIQLFKDAVDINIYTPGSNAGIPLTVLRSFAAPPQAIRDNNDSMRERVSSAVSGLLSLVGIDADPLKSREHILISNLVDRSWRDGNDLDLNQLIREIQKPPFRQLGAFDIESFFPEKDRFGLSMALNNLLASPGFANWMQGESLDIQKLLYSDKGKPQFAIMSIAHLGDAERMFFVTILLNEMIAWMRSQSGTTSLRAILYMDEVFGYFPPVANPPSKQPMLTLLKQARAFGLGCVLATQNPVDLDYKGLSNAGTWFLGRLQTERDKARVLDGLEGASTVAGAAFDRKSLEKTLSGLGNRVFLMNNVHDDKPVVFQSRWALSFLRGPINSEQIRTLMQAKKSGLPTAAPAATKAAVSRPSLPPGITEVFLPRRASKPAGSSVKYTPCLLARSKVHYVSTANGIDHAEAIALLAPVAEELGSDIWDAAQIVVDGELEFDTLPEEGASFGSLPAELTKAKQYTTFAKDVRDSLYRGKRLSLFKEANSKIVSQPGETESAFRVRLSHESREDRDQGLEKLKKKYAPKFAALQERRRIAEQRVEVQKDQKKSKTMDTVIQLGTTVLGAIFGRKKMSASNMSKVGTSARSAGKILSQQSKVDDTEENVAAVDARIAALEADFKVESDKLNEMTLPDKLSVVEFNVQPKKTDIDVNNVVLAWNPMIVNKESK
jgi:hypothetical protein